METDGMIEHRRGDGELVGWMRPAGEGFVAIDLLGREVSGEIEWLAAEELLEQRGLGYLAEPFLLEVEPGQHRRVRLTEVSTRRIRVKDEDYGDITASMREYTLDWPAPAALRPFV